MKVNHQHIKQWLPSSVVSEPEVRGIVEVIPKADKESGIVSPRNPIPPPPPQETDDTPASGSEKKASPKTLTSVNGNCKSLLRG